MQLIDIIIFILVLSGLIIVHEFGHFITARLNHIRVDEFAIGFGKPIFRKKFKETFFLICMIPLGGYVKLAGDDRYRFKGGNDEFLSKPAGIRARVVIAGPLFNYLFSFIIFWFIFIIGMPYLDNVIGGVMDNSPAQRIGLKAGDRVLEVNGRKVNTWTDIQGFIRKSKDDIELIILRGDERLNFKIKPEYKEIKDIFGREKSLPIIGIKSSMEIKEVKENFFVAFIKAFNRTVELTIFIFQGLYYTIVGVIPFKESLAGPITIFKLTSSTAKEGVVALLHLVGVIGISLSIVNLFPIPVLDGGYLPLLFLEKIRKKPLSEKAEYILTRLGMVLIGVLVILAFYSDILRIFSSK
ncbi:MAG: RIP metalloprotease RseP [Candidatus Omnitrophica bacterium]|nr:RIP metalloprotease RseP [Candidatus Omnitrophota bacterium]MCM8826719.1 RIP metalloprotease RseP [Candidatus Omnitrophota bacterium]